MPLLPHRSILELHKAVVRLRLHRPSLLIGLPDSFAASLPNAPDFASQILSDLGEINRVDRLRDRSVPLEVYDDFLASSSKGTFFNLHIRDQFDFDLVDEG